MPDISDAQADPALAVPDGSIEMRHVFFRYNQEAEKPVLSDISLSIRSGETIGVIGGTGSAKSTLVQMIPRLYEAEEGEVYLYRYSESEDGQPNLENIEDDDEYEIVADAFDELLDDAEYDELVGEDETE